MTVVVLEDAAADLESGRLFYESREPGVGDYFVESLLSEARVVKREKNFITGIVHEGHIP